ncbi:MAG: PhoU family transcriptional regulator, partial [Malacoplasma sp.]|nr:PhoU family transcriptional regulator [Malacoplasma sp.]
MAINYSMTKESEKILRKAFFNFYDHVYDSWKKLSDTYKRHEDISDLDLEKFFLYEDKSNSLEAEMLEECIWHISRNTPVASHLRFIISIIYSISDLERMADYVISIA